MESQVTFSVKLPPSVKKGVILFCKKSGFKTSAFVSKALEEKLADMMDSYDLTEAIKNADGFMTLDELKKELKKHKRL